MSRALSILRGLSPSGQLLRSRLTARFLRLALPVLAIAALAMTGLVWLRSAELAGAKQTRIAEQVEQAAGLLAHPLWNIDQTEVDAQLAVLVSDPAIGCARTRGIEYFEPIEYGEACARREALRRFSVPIRWHDRVDDQEVSLGALDVWADSRVDAATVWATLWPLLTLLGVLTATLVATATLAFSRTVLTPLQRVGQSLHAYRESGERSAVDWRSDDELGDFIAEYNAVLVAQEHTEQDLRRLSAIGQELTATLDLEQAMARVYQLARERLDAHIFLIGSHRSKKRCLRVDFACENDERLPQWELPLQGRPRPATWCVQQRRELIAASRAELEHSAGPAVAEAATPGMESLAYLPLVVEGQLVGCLGVESPKAAAYSAEQLQFLRVLASYAAIALANAERFADIDRAVAERTADMAKLGEIGRELTATLDLEQGVWIIYRQISLRVDVHRFSLHLLVEDGATLEASYVVEAGLRQPVRQYPLDSDDCAQAWCVRTGRELVVAEREQLLLQIPGLAGNGDLRAGRSCESFACFPLSIEGRVLGCLSVQSLGRAAYNAAQLEFLRALSSYTAIAIANAQSYAHLDRTVAERTADIVKLGEIGRELTATLDVEQAIDRVYRHIHGRLDSHVFLVGLCEPEAGKLRIDHMIEADQRLPGFQLDLAEPDRPACWCVREGRELIVGRQDELLNYVGSILPVMRGEPMQSLVYLPLKVEQKVIGCLSLQSPRIDAYRPDQLEFLRVLANYTAIALANALAHRHLIDAQQTLVVQEKMASLGALTAGVAHEINNPTNFITGAAQNLGALMQRFRSFLQRLGGDDIDPEVWAAIERELRPQYEQLETILDGALRISRIVGELRQFTRLDEAERKRIRIAEPIQSTVNLVRTRFDRIAFELDLGMNPELDCHPAKLGQVFMNLIVNACEAAQATGRAGWVRIATAEADEQAVIHVEDNGQGMDEATRKRAFEPFFTTKEVGKGTGLGLAISLGIVRDHGGSIEVESAPDQGCRFTVRLPLTSAKEARP